MRNLLLLMLLATPLFAQTKPEAVTLYPDFRVLQVGDTVSIRASLTRDTRTWWGQCVAYTISDTSVIKLSFIPSGTQCVTSKEGKFARLTMLKPGIATLSARTISGGKSILTIIVSRWLWGDPAYMVSDTFSGSQIIIAITLPNQKKEYWDACKVALSTQFSTNTISKCMPPTPPYAVCMYAAQPDSILFSYVNPVGSKACNKMFNFVQYGR